MDRTSASVIKPDAALLSIIDSCSVGCRFCFRADKTGTAMTARDFSRTLCRLTELGVSRVTLTGGEPLEHPSLLKLLSLSTPFPLALSIITSGKSKGALPILYKAGRWLSGVTISADSSGAQRVGGVDRAPEHAFQIARELAPIQCSVHILFHRVTKEELAAWSYELEKSTNVSLEMSALQLGEADRLRNGITRSQALKVLECDISLIEATLDTGPLFLSARKKLMDRLNGSSNEDCRNSRYFVSARGEMRRCPYQKQGSVSIHAARAEIRKALLDDWTSILALEPRCVGICH